MFVLEHTVKVGDLITSISVVFAIATFFYTWSKDRKLRTKEYSDRVRSAAAITLAKTDRCESLFLSFYHLVQPIITETDELMVKEQDAVTCRDAFWKQVTNARFSILAKFSDEQIELAYAPLLPFRNDIYARFRSAIRKARDSENEFFLGFLDQSQVEILNLSINARTGSAVLGNAVREVLNQRQGPYSKKLREALAPLRQFLSAITESGDTYLVKGFIED